MRCGTKHGLQVHEIERKSHASRRWGVSCNYLLVCGECHEGVFATMPHARQLAIKWLKDRTHFNLEQWLRIRDPDLKAPDRVTMGDVREWIEECTLNDSSWS